MSIARRSSLAQRRKQAVLNTVFECDCLLKNAALSYEHKDPVGFAGTIADARGLQSISSNIHSVRYSVSNDYSIPA
ncbi:MAG: hypothetical protein HYR56_17915 [Acidobacteria bacterium]|nr:hypothetical protein [Acidobacteriota bacterium]MBI3424107.1 hypothetical protein [Acidobacteriota bacterium]